MSEIKSVKILVYGRVQGVFYRIAIQKAAEQLEVSGYVKNVPGGMVEVYVSGPTDKVDQFIEKCRVGSGSSSVDRLKIIDVTVERVRGFQIMN